MDTTYDPPDLSTSLTKGQVRVVPRMSSERTRRMGSERGKRDDTTLAEVDGPWGALRISVDGYPLVVRAQIDRRIVATLTSISPTFDEEGPVPTFTDRDVPLVLGDLHTGVRFVAQGSRLRPAGRKRFLRVTSPDHAWTYGGSETQTAGDHPLGRALGSMRAATELRRGPDPSTGQPVVTWQHNQQEDEKDPSGRNYLKLSWADGATVGEIVMTLLLHLGTNEVKLTPLWWRAVDLGGAF